MRYEQPDEWPINADYSKYLYKEVLTGETLLDYQKAKKILMKIPKLGEVGVDELLLKLGSFLRQS